MKKKIGILLENRFIEKEIFYYQSYFETEGYQPVFLTRLWGQPRLTFKGLEYQAEMTVDQSFENLTDEDLAEYGAIIVPAGYVADYLFPPPPSFCNASWPSRRLSRGLSAIPFGWPGRLRNLSRDGASPVITTSFPTCATRAWSTRTKMSRSTAI